MLETLMLRARLWRLWLTGLIILMVPAVPVQAQPTMQEVAGLRWVCGGAGADERREQRVFHPLA